MRNDRSDRRAVAEIIDAASRLDDDEAPTPILDRVLPRLRALMRAEHALAYRPNVGEDGRWFVERIILEGEPSAEALATFRGFIEAQPAPTPFCWYDPLRPQAEQRDRVVAPAHLVSEREWLESQIIREAFAPCGMERFDQIRALLCDGSVLMSWFGAIRSEPFTAREERLLTQLVGPMRARLRLERRLAHAAVAEGGLIAALERIPSAAFVLTHAARVAYANELGRALLDRGVIGASELRAWARQGPTASGASRSEIHALGLPPHVLVTLPRVGPDRDARLARARDLWRLTARQVDVLARVVDGDSNKAIAEALSCVVNTVEVHVSAILRKAGVDNRSALVARFWTALG